MMMPCAVCGQQYDVPMVSDFGILAFGFRCEACSEAIDRAERASHARTIARHSGVMTDDDLAVMFAGNDKEKEGNNLAAWAAARKWAEAGLPKNVYVYGNPGTGKTRLALCVVNELMARGESAGIVRCPDIQRHAKAFPGVQEPFIHRFAAPVNLVVDDIDTSIWTQDGIILLRQILDIRAISIMAGRAKRIIVTANVDFRTVYERIGTLMGDHAGAASMFDRMKPIMPLEMKGKSLR